MKVILKNLLSLLVLSIISSNLFYSQLTQAENYIYSKTYLEPVTTSSTAAKGSETVTYFDGLGRPTQSINVKAGKTNATDLVTPIIYDEFGRQIVDILPIPAQTENRGIHSGMTENSGSGFYGSRPYAEKALEDSPLNRVQQQFQPGTAWDDHPLNYDYLSNGNNDVLKFSTITAFGNGIFYTSQLLVSGYYTASTLYKNMMSDEDGNITYEFKNKDGQTILIRKVLVSSNVAQQSIAAPINSATNVDTYYIYNEYNQLAFVISPLAVNSFRANSTQIISNPKTVSNAILDNLCYQYNYDSRNRMAEKKLPGKGWESMVYDKTDRVVMSQDANLASQGKWLITKYDKFGRVICTGFHPYGDRAAAQSLVENMVITEERSSMGFAQNGLQIYYERMYFNGMESYLSVNYYDTYPDETPFPDDNKILDEPILLGNPDKKGRSTKTLPVASFVKNIDNNNWTKNYSFYDSKRRRIGTTTINHFGGSTIVNTKLDFAGVVLKNQTLHKKLASQIPVNIVEDFTYDHQNRLKRHYHEVVGKTAKEMLTDNTYDDIGRITIKNVGTVSDASFNEVSSPLQTINYDYNIRGWMTGINLNSTGNLDISKLFSYKIKYNDPATNPIQKFNGNISEVDWSYGSFNPSRYEYTYDNLNRLTKGYYKNLNGTTTTDSKFYNEELTYDVNGNIKTLRRNARPRTGQTATQVDNLKYYYENNELSNRLMKINDNEGFTANANGYPGGGGINTYDPNGNMWTMPDKGITQNITYNFLNLPQEIVKSGQPVTYSYRADGIKIHKGFNFNGETIDTDYVDGFVYSSIYSLQTERALQETVVAQDMSVAGQGEALALAEKPIITDPGTVLLTESKPNFFPTSEGFYDYENFRYIYQYKDHLGNIRLNYGRDDNGVLFKEDGNDYYPFGLNFINPLGGVFQVYNPSATYKNYKYNGKELQETGMYDYGARMYMADIGRWGVVDPLAEKYRRHSTYNYTINNPIKFIDPDGRGVETFGKEAEKMAQALEKKLDKQITKVNKGNALDKNDRITELRQSKKDISDMRNDKTTEYKFAKAGSKSDGNSIKGTYNTKQTGDGIITMFVGKDTALTLHEVKHGGQNARGEYNIETGQDYGVNDEVGAYKAQYSFEGKFIYNSHNIKDQGNLLNQTLFKSGIFPKTIISDISGINANMVNDIGVPATSPRIPGFIGVVPLYPPEGITDHQFNSN